MQYIRTVVLAMASIGIISCADQQTTAGEHTAPLEASTVAAAADTVNAPRLVTQATDDSLLLTAETGKGMGPAIKYMPEFRAFGWFTSADSVVWDVEVKAAGDYDVFMEWSVDDKEAGKTFLLKSGSNTLSGNVGKSGSWETYKAEHIGQLKLDAGRQSIVFGAAEAFGKDAALLDLRNLTFVRKR